MTDSLPAVPDAGFSVIGEIVPPEILAPPMPHERRWLWRDECALVLDRFLRRLARQEALCRSVLGRIGEAFLRRRSHHRLGFARLGDYARERLGISGRELQSFAQVVASMERLPRIRAAFERGEASWAQARILVDVATVDTEEEWLSRAAGRTVRALAAFCKEQGRAAASEDDHDEDTIDREPRARFRVSCPRRVSSRWRRAVELARSMSGEELSAWQAAEAIAAEGLSSSELDVERLDESTIEPAVAREPRNDRNEIDPNGQRVSTPALDWAAISEAIPEPVEALARDLDDGDAFALDDRMRRVLRSMSRVNWQLGRLLRLFLDMRLHELAGFRSASEYARDRLGMSARKARALVHLERKAARAPALGDAYRAGDISWARALAIVPVLDERHAAQWVERATSTTFRRLVDEVEWAVETCDAVAPFLTIAPPPPGAALVLPERQTCARGVHDGRDERPAVDSEVLFTGPASVVGLLRVAVSAYARPYEAPWRGLERLLDHVLGEWTSQPAHRDPVFARDGWRCAVPACSSRRNLHDHHIVFRSRGGDNARDNRVAVCAWHHLRGLHGGLVRASGRAPGEVHWQLAARAGRPPLLESLGETTLPWRGEPAWLRGQASPFSIPLQ